MLSREILKIGTLTLLLGTTLFAEGSNCTNGACFVPLIKLADIKGVDDKACKSCFTSLDKTIPVIYTQNKVLNLLPEVEDESLLMEIPEEEQEIHEIIRVENFEESFLEKTSLSNSKSYCENNKNALFNLSSDVYECV